MSTSLLYSFKSIIPCFTHVRNYSVKAAGTGSLMGLGKGKKSAKSATVEKIAIPVETDPYKLVNYVCGSNIYKDGEDVKIQPDSEYPDWLWEMKAGRAPRIHELDPTTKEYWVRVRRYGLRQKHKMRKSFRY